MFQAAISRQNQFSWVIRRDIRHFSYAYIYIIERIGEQDHAWALIICFLLLTIIIFTWFLLLHFIYFIYFFSSVPLNIFWRIFSSHECQAHIYYKGHEGCAAFLANIDNTSDAYVTFNGSEYYLPAWSVSILPDCTNEIYNTAKVRWFTSHADIKVVYSET